MRLISFSEWINYQLLTESASDKEASKDNFYIPSGFIASNWNLKRPIGLFKGNVKSNKHGGYALFLVYSSISYRKSLGHTSTWFSWPWLYSPSPSFGSASQRQKVARLRTLRRSSEEQRESHCKTAADLILLPEEQLIASQWWSRKKKICSAYQKIKNIHVTHVLDFFLWGSLHLR